MSSLKVRYEKFCEFMEKNTKGVEIGIYSVSGLLFAFSYYKIRPITKFGRPQDIPKHFITEKVVQKGSIKSIEPTESVGALLRIDHKPPLNIFFSSKKTLPVKIFGIDLNSNGLAWLQTVTVNRNVQFLPIEKKKNFVECQVKLLQDPALNAKPTLDLAESLLSLGFAKLSDQKSPSDLPSVLSADEQLKKYFATLNKTQVKAKNGRQGIWSVLIPPPPWPLSVIKSKTSKAIHNHVLPTKMRLPELVR